MRQRWLVVFLVLFFFSSAFQSDAQELSRPSPEPVLRINADEHTSTIRRIGADAACKIVATSSEDKTIRIWGMPDGKLLNVLRPPIGGGQGKLYAVGVAPDGRWLAAGGWTRTGGDHWVYIFDTTTGSMVTRLGSFSQVVQHIAVSPDGKFMAATFRGGEGLRVWAKKGTGFRDWKLVVHDSNYGKKDIYAAAFSNSGALYTAGYDGRLRRYEADFKFKPLIQRTRNGTLPYSVALSPAGDKLAVGYTDSSAVDVFDAKSLKFSYAPSVQGVVGYLNAVAWSRDGRRLFAAGNFETQKKYVIRSWEDDGTGAIRAPPGSVPAEEYVEPPFTAEADAGDRCHSDGKAHGLTPAKGDRWVHEELAVTRYCTPPRTVTAHLSVCLSAGTNCRSVLGIEDCD